MSATAIAVTLTKKDGSHPNPLYTVNIGDHKSQGWRYRHYEELRDTVKTELGVMRIAVSDFPGKLGKQAYGLPLNDADCEERCKVNAEKSLREPKVLCSETFCCLYKCFAPTTS